MIELFYGSIIFQFILVKLYYTQSLEEEEEVKEGDDITSAFIKFI